MSDDFWSLPKTIRWAIFIHVLLGGGFALFFLFMLKGSVFLGPQDIVICLLGLIVSALILVAAYGLRKGKEWARFISIVLFVLMIPAFPLGTYWGIRMVAGLTSSEVKKIFEAAGEQPVEKMRKVEKIHKKMRRVEKIHENKGVPGLIRALARGDEHMREAAIEALLSIGAPAVEPLITALKDSDWLVREGAATALARIADVQAVEPLIAALSDEYLTVREQVTEALVRIGAPAVESLIEALKNKNSSMRKQAAIALGRISDERSVEPLIAALKDENSSVCGQVVEALVTIGAPAVEPLTTALKDVDSNVRGQAATALGRIGDERTVEPLIAALKDENSNVRGQAVEALVTIGAPAVEPLVAALKDEDSNVRGQAVTALGKIGDERSVEPLIVALKDENSSMREQAVKALIRISAPAVEPLVAALKDEDRNVRGLAALALGGGGDERAEEPLRTAALEDEDNSVREMAAIALKLMKVPKWELKTQSGQKLGSYDMPGIVRLVREGKINENDLVRSGDTEWKTLKDSALMDEFALGVLFDPVKAHANRGSDIGMLAVGHLAVLGASFSFLVSSEAQPVWRAVIVSVGMVFAVTIVLRSIPSLRTKDDSGCCAGCIGLVLLAIILSLVCAAPGGNWGNRLVSVAGTFLVAVVAAIGGGVLGWLLGYVTGGIVGLFRAGKYQAPA